jgi:hypothetical protein
VQAEAESTSVHVQPPVAVAVQHAPWRGQGFGLQLVAVTLMPLGYGQGTAVEQAPVAGSQHTCVTVTAQVIWMHVRPSEKIIGGWQCETSGTIEHRPVLGSQQAPCVPGGHGKVPAVGVQLVAVLGTVPVGQAEPATVWQVPVMGSQQMIVCVGHVTPVQVVPIPRNVPLQAVAELTGKHPYTPAALRPQHAPVCGGQGLGTHEVPGKRIGYAGGQTVPGITWHVPPLATSQHTTT